MMYLLETSSLKPINTTQGRAKHNEDGGSEIQPYN
jgi:hypothetical protein